MSDEETITLPPSNGRIRWVSRVKVNLLLAIERGIITREQACARYELSMEELASWEKAFAKSDGGKQSLLVKILSRQKRITPTSPQIPDTSLSADAD